MPSDNIFSYILLYKNSYKEDDQFWFQNYPALILPQMISYYFVSSNLQIVLWLLPMFNHLLLVYLRVQLLISCPVSPDKDLLWSISNCRIVDYMDSALTIKSYIIVIHLVLQWWFTDGNHGGMVFNLHFFVNSSLSLFHCSHWR